MTGTVTEFNTFSRIVAAILEYQYHITEKATVSLCLLREHFLVPCYVTWHKRNYCLTKTLA